MALPVWPQSLPQAPLSDAYGEQLARGVIRSTMAQGPAKVRVENTNVPYVVHVEFILTVEQTAIFDEFYLTTLSKIKRFEWTNYRTDETIESRIIVDQGSGPEYASIGVGLYRLSFDLEILP